MYFNGQGFEKNYILALEWYTKSANQGNSDAQNYVGECYQDGLSVSQDYRGAIIWFQKAVYNNENASAQFNIGLIYDQGQGVPINISTDYIYGIEIQCPIIAWMVCKAVELYYNGNKSKKFMEEMISLYNQYIREKIVDSNNEQQIELRIFTIQVFLLRYGVYRDKRVLEELTRIGQEMGIGIWIKEIFRDNKCRRRGFT